MSSEPLFNENQIKASLLTPVDENGAEKTAAGSLIGSVRDLLQGSAKTAHEKQQRAHMNDMLAEVAVDTFAMMPGVSWLKAGTVRGALMINPNEDIKGNAMTFGLNFTEGVALNRLSKAAGKMLHDPMASRNLLSESTGLFKFGAGMGGVKAIFDEHTWQNKDGAFSFGDGIANVAKAGTIGGVIGIPAGMAGTRLARLGMTHFAESGLSPRAMSIGLGAMSGYPAGAIFGGVDAAIRGGNTTEVLDAAHTGGLMGMFAGGLTGAMIRHDAVPRISPADDRHDVVQRATSSGDRDGVTTTTAGSDRDGGTTSSDMRVLASPETSELAMQKRQRATRMYQIFDDVRIPQKVDLEGNLKALGDYRPGRLAISEPQQNADDIARATAAWEDFTKSARRRLFTDSRVYNLNGIELQIPEAYAKALDEVYNLRVTQQRGYAPEANSQQKMAALMAKSALETHPLRDRAHPADLMMIDQLPDRSLIKRIEMFDHDYWNDPWIRKTHPDHRTVATASDDGVMSFYKANANWDLNRIVHHEWAHLLANNAVRDAKVYQAAAELEKFSHDNRKEPGWTISDYAKRNVDENWAEHGAGITKADPGDFFEVSEQAPLRTAVYARALAKSLALAPPDQRSPFATQLSRRVQYVQESVLPRAQQILEGYLLKGNSSEQIHAAKLLRELGDKRHFELLKQVAKTSRDDAVATETFEAARQMAEQGRESWRGYNVSEGGATIHSYVDFLVDMAGPTSGVRSLALHYLGKYNTNKAEGYYALYSYQTNHGRGTQLKSLLEAMKKIPDVEGKEQAWDAAKRVAKSDTQAQFGLALTVYSEVPALRNLALRQMVNLDGQKVEHILLDLAKKPDHPQHKTAVEGLQTLETQILFQRLEKSVKSSDPKTREQAIRELGETKNNRALPSLLGRYAFGETATERALAYQMIHDNFNRQIVKAEIHRLTREDSRWYQPLRPIMENRAVGVVVDVKR